MFSQNKQKINKRTLSVFDDNSMKGKCKCKNVLL